MRTLLALNDSDTFVGRQDLSHILKTISFDSWRVEQRFIAKHFLEFLLSSCLFFKGHSSTII